MPKLYLSPEDNMSGHVDSSFDMPSIKDCSCPACDEELNYYYGDCEINCGCYCHHNRD